MNLYCLCYNGAAKNISVKQNNKYIPTAPAPTRTYILKQTCNIKVHSAARDKLKIAAFLNCRIWASPAPLQTISVPSERILKLSNTLCSVDQCLPRAGERSQIDLKSITFLRDRSMDFFDFQLYFLKQRVVIHVAHV